MKINRISARQILDSRGNPSLEVEVYTSRFNARASVPSGASTGVHEAWELRDKGPRFNGEGVRKASFNVEKKIQPALKGFPIGDQRLIDETMIKLDGTNNKKRLGANSILGVSLAVARAGAINHNLPLYEYLAELYSNRKMLVPVPFANLINGGAHAGSPMRFQEFMIAPVKARSFSEAVMIVSETYRELKNLLEQSMGKSSTNVGDEGGFAPPLKRPEEALELLESAADEAGHLRKVKMAIDVASSQFFDTKTDTYNFLGNRNFSRGELLDYYVHLTNSFRIFSIEDPFDQDDFLGFNMITRKLGKSTQIIGDDLTVSNVERIKQAISGSLCNSLLLKVNQIGTLTEALEAAHLAQRNHWSVMVAHRSGETEDPFIADLAVGLGAGQIKLGAPARGERTSKYNQLLRIEESLGRKARYGLKY